MNIEQLAAEALLAKGAGLRIPAPFLYRLFGRKYMTLNVQRLYLGALLYISRISALGKLEPIEVGEERKRILQHMGCDAMTISLTDIEKNNKELTQAVAACLLNNPLKIRLFGWWLARVLRRRCHADQLQEIVMWLFAYSRMESFRNTTELLRTMSMTKPRTSGQIKRS